jgi:hypothetical protein
LKIYKDEINSAMQVNKKLFSLCSLLLTGIFLLNSCNAQKGNKNKSEPADSKYRVIVSTDIGGTDPDDFQSMVHLFLYADTIEIEGLISSPFGPGRKEHILQVIDQYEKDYPNLKTYSEKYPAPDSLRSITKQGATDVAGYAGFDKPTEGSEWIVKCARKKDSRPLYILVWGGIEDLAQALHDAPDISPKLRVYYIGGPNKKWTPDAYQYIAGNFPDLWIIESNATYRGWFTGGNQYGEWSNEGFPEKHINDKGALGTFFMTQLGGSIKMGDTPSLAWLLNSSNPEDPTLPNWGGQYVKAWERPYYLFDKLPSKSDSIQEFSILEIAISLKGNLPEKPEARLLVENQALSGYFLGDGKVRFRFSPKSAKIFDFKIESNINSLNEKTGSITAYIPPAELANHPSSKYPNWWTDNPNPEFAEGEHIGAKTVSRWREEFLKDFAKRMERCVYK